MCKWRKDVATLLHHVATEMDRFMMDGEGGSTTKNVEAQVGYAGFTRAQAYEQSATGVGLGSLLSDSKLITIYLPLDT